ncbi:unnamed protein product [Rotaria sordida]|uniref:Sphingolipid delta4-desaturase N-terminal domain-containing protein n=1 Tax=Rotaria sordida TaxID=392033 RepID=A0A814BLA0_9BILA|nr:unnamed protein product [Rotaria sordida]
MMRISVFKKFFDETFATTIDVLVYTDELHATRRKEIQKYPEIKQLMGHDWHINTSISISITLKKYHLDHHRFQGHIIYDTDISTHLEIFLFSSRFGKLIFLIIIPFLYSCRSIFILSNTIHYVELINLIIVFIFNSLIFSFFFNIKTSLYFLLSTIFGFSLHSISGHFIAEYYVFKQGYETYSYYGPLNAITYNVGYHNEHKQKKTLFGSVFP